MLLLYMQSQANTQVSKNLDIISYKTIEKKKIISIKKYLQKRAYQVKKDY